MVKKFAAAAAIALAAVGLSACTPDSQRASENLSKEADSFKIDRRIVFFNGITDKYLLTIEGKCSIQPDGGKLDVTCKVGENAYKKHFLGLSDNVSYFVEQTESADVSVYHYKVIFKPENIIPAIDLQTGNQ